MPEIDRARLSAKLDTIPEQDREPYLIALKEKGYTWRSAAPVSAPKTGVLNGITTQNLGDASKLDPLAQAARLGQFANRGNQELSSLLAEGAGRAGAAVGRVGLPRLGKAITGAGVGAAGTLATASETLLPQTRLGVAGYAVKPTMSGYQAIKGAFKSAKVAKPGIIAQLAAARSKVPAQDVEQALRDPSVFKAPTVEAANKAYGESVGQLKSAARTMREQTGKTLLGESDWTEAINRPGRILAGIEKTSKGKKVKMDGQTALEGIQAINRFTRNKANTAKLDKEQLGELLTQKESLISWLENNGTPGMRQAASVLRKAHVRENLSRLVPQNKFGGTDVLRSTLAGTAGMGALSLALAGHPAAAIPFAAEAVTASPAFWGGAIRNYQAISRPEVSGRLAALAAMRAKGKRND